MHVAIKGSLPGKRTHPSNRECASWRKNYFLLSRSWKRQTYTILAHFDLKIVCGEGCFSEDTKWKIRENTLKPMKLWECFTKVHLKGWFPPKKGTNCCFYWTWQHPSLLVAEQYFRGKVELLFLWDIYITRHVAVISAVHYCQLKWPANYVILTPQITCNTNLTIWWSLDRFYEETYELQMIPVDWVAGN